MVTMHLPISKLVVPNGSSLCRCWYTNQSRTARNCDDFFTDENAIRYYLQNAETIMNRQNTITNLAYNEDPTIMAWNLINEGRCEQAGCDASQIQVCKLHMSCTPIRLDYACHLETFAGMQVGHGCMMQWQATKQVNSCMYQSHAFAMREVLSEMRTCH